jgi:outer membrane receptor protein involved in Fe transport
MKQTMVRLGIAAAILLLALPGAYAQTTGEIDGRIIDSSGAILPGVSVTATSPALAGARSTVTDANGRFRMLGLPPGVYKIQAEVAGFTTVEQTGVRVGLDRSVTLEFTLKPAAVAETVTVTGEAPVIDITSTTTGANFSEDVFQNIPVARTVQGLAFNAPGVVSGGLGDNPSVGGASAAENRYILDGLDTTDPAFGTSGSSLPFEFVQEVEVKTGGYEAEYGGALGGVLNVLTKSGSNDLHGDIFGYFTNDSLQKDSPPTATVGQDRGIDQQYDFGLGIGGPLAKDKVWFFGAINPSFTDRQYLTRQELPLTSEEKRYLYSAKLTFQLNPNHRVVLSSFGDPGKIDGLSTAARRDAAGIITQNEDYNNYNFQLSYNAILSPNVFFELAAGRSQLGYTSAPTVDTPFYEDRTSTRRFASAQNCGDSSLLQGGTPPIFAVGCLGGSFTQENGDTSRNEFRGSLNWAAKTGSVNHQWKFGAHFRRNEYTDLSHYPAPSPSAYRDASGDVVEANGIAGQRYRLFNSTYALIEYDQNSAGTTDEFAFFIQDQLQIGQRFTLNLGLRFDKSNSTGVRSDEFPDRKLDFGFGDMIAPRLGFTWDIAGNGKSKLFGHYGKFYESIPLDINARSFGNEQFNFFYSYYPADGSLPTASNPGTTYYIYRLGTGVGVQEGLKPQYSEEFVGGFEYEVARNFSIGVKGTRRQLGDVIEDISVDGGHTYFIANPGGTYTANPVTGEVLLDDEGNPAPVTFPLAERNYTAFELSFNKAFSNNWQLAASYVWSKNEGNYGGLFRQDNGQLDPNITSIFDLPSLLEGAFGLLNNDRPHQFKAYGSYQWPFKLVTGFYGEVMSGTPISKLGGHTVYGRRERFITDRGTEGRTPTFSHLDLHLEYPIKLSERTNLRLIADVFNIFAREEAFTVDNEWTLARAEATTDPNECGGADPACPNGNDNYGLPLTFQDPFRVRIGVRLSW